MRLHLKFPAAAIAAFAGAAMGLFLSSLPASAQSQWLKVEGAWVRPTGVRVTAGYMVLRNVGRSPLRLSSARTPMAGRVEIHTMKMENGVMKMRRVEWLTIAPGGTLVLKPGGYHLMIMGLKTTPLREGTKVPIVLGFDGGREYSITATVRRRPPAAH